MARSPPPSTPVSMKDSITNTCWFLGSLVGLCFVVFTITEQQPKALDKCKAEDPNATATTCSLMQDCNFGVVFRLTMSGWMKCAILFFLTSIISLWRAKSSIDPAAGEEGRTASDDIKTYKAACEEYTEAAKAATIASNVCKAANFRDDDKKSRDDFQECVEKLATAGMKMKNAKPARGMEWVYWRKSSRFYYLLALVCLTLGVVCADIAFFLSLEAEIGCVKNDALYLPFIIPACYVTYISSQFMYECIMHN